MAGEWQETATCPPRAATRAVQQEGIERICRRQKQLIRLDQLVAAGLSPRAVRDRAAAGRLHRIHPAVYALHPPPYSRAQRRLAAVFACGPGSLLSDLDAACHLGFADTPPLTAHVTNASGRGRSLAGITVHRRVVARGDRLIRDGIPCTSPTRTVVDCAASASLDQLEDLLLAADAKRMLNRRRLDELLIEHAGRRGIANLRRLITDDRQDTRSKTERRLLRICRHFGVPRPLTNHRIRVGDRTFYADFCWPDLRLIVEADSWRWHGGRIAGESDADRDQLLAIAGWRVVHFTRDQIRLQPDRTGRRLLALTASSAAVAGSSPAVRR